MSEHVTDHLSEYIDGELPAAERASVDVHLRACGACAGALDDLRRVIAAAGGAVAADAPPPNAADLWAGIRGRIESPSTASHANHRVASFRDPAARQAPRRISLSIGQLAAAAALIVALSAATAWYVRGGAAPNGAPAPAMIEVELEPTPDPSAVRMVNFADAAYDAAVSDLERTLAERRNDLNPRTVEILERNLKLIDAAIAQARQALENDPGNTYLNRHLVDSRRRKLDLLRRAATINEAD